ncbi:LysR substrate-binding domain-containing protein [Streptomyces sp. RTd22]|uniref:LysR substrate-binding domain-containing protein n=1 Tax=Streptomyces sp. RTd22 TaxID=1841249 RepID=UPI000AB1B733
MASPAWADRVAEHPATGDLCAALRDVPMVTYAEDLPIVRRYWRTAFGKQLTARAAVTVPNLYAVLSAVNAGAGYSVLPRSLCQEHLDSGRLALLHDPEVPAAEHALPRPAPRHRDEPGRPPGPRPPPAGGPLLVAPAADRGLLHYCFAGNRPCPALLRSGDAAGYALSPICTHALLSVTERVVSRW